MTDAVTLDRFLNGRITVAQPISGFRAGHDTVLLAAAVPPEPNTSVLELGSGAGVASLCLAARVPDVRITGIEIDPQLVRLANENAARNAVSDRVHFVVADATSSPLASLTPESTSPLWGGRTAVAHRRESGPGGGRPTQELLGSENFDHVFFNPPFHPDSANISPIAARDRATRDSSDAVRTWTGRALSLVRDGGTVTAIIRADRLDDILDGAAGCEAIVFPLFRRASEPARRAIVRVIKTKGGVAHAAGLVLHESDGRPTPAAEAVLRHAQPLRFA